MKAVIPAAGYGTRFLPATKAQPKEMLPIYDKPTLQYLVEEAIASGIDDILIVNVLFAAPDGVANAHLVFLADVGDVGKVSDFPDFFEVTVLSRPLQCVFKFI